MPGVNTVTLIGYLGADPALTYTSSGKPVCKVNLATTEKWRDKASNQQREHTEWHRLVFWERRAELVNQYCTRGSMLYVVGKLRTKKWERDGVTHWTTEVLVESMQFLDGRPKTAEPERTAPAPTSRPAAAPEPPPFDDDIPF
jgi:single-strand DNA-binding protein